MDEELPKLLCESLFMFILTAEWIALGLTGVPPDTLESLFTDPVWLSLLPVTILYPKWKDPGYLLEFWESLMIASAVISYVFLFHSEKFLVN